MEIDYLIAQLEISSDSAGQLTALPDDVANALVERLKQEADRHWHINANRSLELANLIIQVGQSRGNLQQVALGTMARGDALRLLGQLEDAWTVLDEAGEIFQSIGDEIGWARTRIGRLPAGVDLNRVEEALAGADAAAEIFTRYGELERLVRLQVNIAWVYNLLGNYQQALPTYRAALESAQSLGKNGEVYLGSIYLNMGYAYYFLGNYHQAQTYYDQARGFFVEWAKTRDIAIVDLNSAHIAQAQGRYRRALFMFHNILNAISASLPTEAALARRAMVECLLSLNRYQEAREIAHEVVSAYKAQGTGYEVARTLLHLATAEAELASWEAARLALAEAEPIFVSLRAESWLATLYLRRGRIALKQGDPATALTEAHRAASCFQDGNQQTSYAEAVLLYGQAMLATANAAAASQSAREALLIAQRANIPPLRYNAHLLLGRIAEASNDHSHAIRRYQAATATVARMQRGLTITLRPGFLEDKDEAFHSLIRLHLGKNAVEQAFDTLERAKYQVFLDYVTNRESLRWAQDDPDSRQLMEELNMLREEHQWFYYRAHRDLPDENGKAVAFDQQQALVELAIRERRMRSITERLYLQTAEGHSAVASLRTPSVRDIQANLHDDSLMVEFYNDGQHIWVFTLDHCSVEAQQLSVSVQAFDQLLRQLQFNVACALRLQPDTPAATNLAAVARTLCRRLYDGLIGPISHRLVGHERIVIVPYGALHFLPFHLLHTGAGYLVEEKEIRVLPTAGLLAQHCPRREPGALVLAHSRGDQLLQTRVEAQMVHRLLGGELYCDESAVRQLMQTHPRQVLHIAAHGEYRMDQPDLSYIELADGQLYTDDLVQHDLSYELVTLSACETGRANVAAGDELIGLGRGFLYAGAGALIVSLWRVNDMLAGELMESIYQALQGGQSKAASLRGAQRALLRAKPQLHPAFWGSFQLIGDPSPLSH